MFLIQAGGTYSRFEDDPEDSSGRTYGTITETETSFTETSNGVQPVGICICMLWNWNNY
jgi:hypothetical protein